MKTKIPSQIVVLAEYRKDTEITQEEALAQCKEKGLRLLTNLEVDAILQDESSYKKYSDAFPVWTGTHVSYDGKECTITENGKVRKTVMPESNAWYEQDEQGLPFGKPSNQDKPEARYLWRVRKNSSLLVRWCWGWFVYFRRGVVAYGRPSDRCGVLATPVKKTKGD